jgi:DNA replication protein DnaC
MTRELTETLRKLNLSGMLDCLDARKKEAIANQMSHLEFLSLLSQDELLAREQRRYERRYKKANFKGLKTIENFNFSFNPKINQSLIRDLSTCHFIKEKSPVLIMGPCGTGKSHLAQALGHCALQKGFDVMCTTQSRLSEELQAARAVNTYGKKMATFTKIALIIIDDFGLKPLRSPQDEDLHELIAERSEQASTIFTSNLTLDEWQQAFSNKLLGIATIDRLRHNAYQVFLEGKSYRNAKNEKKK